MKYCISGRQSYSVLKKADEIMVNSNDREIILDYVEKIPNKIIILDLGDNASPNFNFDLWKMYDEKFERFCVALHNLNYYKDMNDNGIKWFWPFPITSFYELNKILELGPICVEVGPPLSFDLERVKRICGDVEIRMCCNCARPLYLPDDRETANIKGQWIRPEDIDLYGQYVSTVYFDNVPLQREETLLNIYKEQRQWPGNLNLILEDLHYNVDNRVLTEDLIKARMNCGQRCFSGGTCHLCENAFMFATKLREEHYRRLKESAN